MADLSQPLLVDQTPEQQADYFVSLAAERLRRARTLLETSDPDADGDIADAIQQLLTALKIVRDIKKEAQGGDRKGI